MALLLSLLALLAPDLTLAPMVAREPHVGGPRPVDQLEPAPAAARNGSRPLDLADLRTAGGILPPARPAPDGAAFQRALDAARAEGGAHGISFAIARGGELVWAGSSGRTRDGSPLTPQDPMVIGSVTKTFVAATILELTEEGTLNLDDPVRGHLPELREVSGQITVRQLLDHTSGLADLFNDTTRTGLEENPGHAWDAGELLATLRDPWYAPGDGWAYANTNYYLLGLIVERVTGHSLDEVLEARFLAPLGLGSTRILAGAEGDPLEPAWTSIFWASGAMAATAGDLARWGDALYADGVLTAASRAAMLSFNRHDYGLGVQEINVGKLTGYGHTGLLNTYTTLLFHVPSDRVTVALLVNRSHVDLGAMLRAEPRDGPSLLELALGRP